jgi:hypothetical protein
MFRHSAQFYKRIGPLSHQYFLQLPTMTSKERGEVVFSKTVLSNFCPKQANERIGAFVF